MAVRSASGTLTANTALSVSLTAPASAFAISNAGTVPIFYRTDGVTAVVGADLTGVVLAGEKLVIPNPTGWTPSIPYTGDFAHSNDSGAPVTPAPTAYAGVTFSLISTGTPTYVISVS